MCSVFHALTPVLKWNNEKMILHCAKEKVNFFLMKRKKEPQDLKIGVDIYFGKSHFPLDSKPTFCFELYTKGENVGFFCPWYPNTVN